VPSQTLPELIEQVDRIERQVRAISEHLGIPYESPLTYASDEHGSGTSVPPEVEQLAREGKKIEAIKLMRESSGMGLAEAKDAVEGLDGV
jgi:ribosomal protein L7/L12